MKRFIERIKENETLLSSVNHCETKITPILQKFITNFPEYTDHSIVHSKSVLVYAAHLLNTEIEKLNEDEVYVLIMAGYLHDIGMCPTKEMKKEIEESSSFKDSGKSFEDYLRIIHHELSYKYIKAHWKDLKIVNEIYADAIALVAMGHRIVDLFDLYKYQPDFPVKSGSEYVCLPYLAGILRLADELDVTNDRIPELLYNQYFPDNKISQKEWEKHKANYLVNFKNDTIKITSECYKKDLYYALIKQYNKIEGVINYIQKLFRIIPQNNRELQLNFSKLEKNVKTHGFLPKEIGFSFDLQNTIDTFIGDNIYKNKNVAIRECLQNAIDTCRYRKQLDKNHYEPQINIILSEKKLIVTDNGLGMDEFIVKNYFAKLAKSYYQEDRVSSEFEAISQFGVGVFSYFLICDYFEVESKLEGKEPVKFLVNKDTDSYFHFFDKTERDSLGTSITFFLRDDMTLDELIQHVKHYVRFVEIPINIYYKDRHEKILTQDFILDKEKDLKSKIVSSKLKKLENLEIIDWKISTDEYDGVIGLIMTKDEQGTYNPSSLFDTFKTYRHHQIELSHKGIYVNNIQDITLDGVIGKLNLKKKKAIDIGRYNIKNNEYLNTIISNFHPRILEKLFNNWHLKQKKTKAQLSKMFLYHYLPYNFDCLKEDVLELFTEHLYFTIYGESGEKQLTLKDLNSIEEIIILKDSKPYIRGGGYKFDDINEVYNYFKKPLLMENEDKVASTIVKLFQLLKRPIEIISSPQHWHFIIKGNQTQYVSNQQEILGSRNIGYIHDKPHIASFPHLDTSSPFNLKHEIIEYCILNSKNISENQELNNLFNEFLSLLHDFMFDFHVMGIKRPTDRIVIINSVLNDINKILLTNFKLSQNDFPDWINQKINWKKT